MECVKCSRRLHSKRLDDVVAFKLEVKTIIAKCKLSQNREIEDFITVKNNMKNRKNFSI